MIRETFPVGPIGCNCTILGDEHSHLATVVDPGADIAHILAIVAKHNLAVQSIVVTHAHIDHIAGALSLKEATGAPIVYSEADLPQLALMPQQADWLGVAVPEVRPPDHSPADTEVLHTGNLRLQVLLTPGHTEGSLCLYLPEHSLLLAGDTLFAGAIGRTDFPGGHHGTLIGSIEDRILPLPDTTIVVPGHGPETTVGIERATNPFLG